ncbi:MAG: hypothetical protein NVSMB14_12600 [Isosphaeraceae bacterium]
MLTLLVGSTVATAADSVRWSKSYASATAEASRTGRPIVLVFGSRNCPWCRTQERTTLRDARVVRELNNATVPLKVDSDDDSQADLLASLRVQSLPTTVVISNDGKVISSRAGYLESAAFLKLVESANSRRR